MRASRTHSGMWTVTDGDLSWTVHYTRTGVAIVNSRGQHLDPYGKRGQEVMRAVAAPVRD